MRAGHGTGGIGFKYGKMKGLKISPARSVARIDHTSFLCANEASVSFCLPIHHPLCPTRLLAPLHPLVVSFCRFSGLLPHRPFTLSSISAGSQHAILQATHPPSAPARAATCVLSRRFADRTQRNVAFTRFS